MAASIAEVESLELIVPAFNILLSPLSSRNLLSSQP